MLVLVLGDSHGDRAFVRDALRMAQWYGADVVVSVGDFGVWPGSSGKMFLDTVDRMAAQRDVSVFVVPGNHEDYEQIYAAPQDDDGWHVLRDRVRAAPRPHVWTWEGTTFLGFGGAASIEGPGGLWEQVRGPVDDPEMARRLNLPVGHDLGGWWPEERISEDEVEAAVALVEERGPIDVTITHDAPAGVELGGGWPLGDEQRRRIRRVMDAARPRHLLCGHWHRFRQQRIEGTTVTMLSADLNPAEPQYAWLHIEPGGSIYLDVPAPWNLDEDSLPHAGGRG